METAFEFKGNVVMVERTRARLEVLL